MSLVKRVKQSVKDYFALDKNIRVDESGEVVARRDELGRELLDPVPLAPPVGWFKQPSMFDQVRDMVRGEHMRMYALSQGNETFEEANDFDVEDDIFPASSFENDFEPLEDLQARRQAEFREEFLREREERYIKRKRREWSEEDVRRAGTDHAPVRPGATSGERPASGPSGAGLSQETSPAPASAPRGPSGEG